MSGQYMGKKREEQVRRNEQAMKLQSRKTVKSSRSSSEVVMRLHSYGKMYEERRTELSKDLNYTFKPTLNHKKNVRIGSRYKSQTGSIRRETDNENLTFKPKICKMSSTIANNLVQLINNIGKS
jgi:hypothetical protein